MDTGTPIRVLCIGAHPDDCELKFGGTAAKFAAGGHAVKFLSVTNGDAGHHLLGRDDLAVVRAIEVKHAAGHLGITASEVLPNHDGEVIPSVELRNDLVRRIRSWNADLVLTHRPYDYHPDHRYTSQLVQDSAYMVLVPSVCPDTPPLRKNPIYMYLQDDFKKPIAFTPDIAVDIDCAWSKKLSALDAHSSQFYEWLPWVEGRSEEVPGSSAERCEWLGETWTKPLTGEVSAALTARYGSGATTAIARAEAFELCEYGRQPSAQELDQLFPR